MVDRRKVLSLGALGAAGSILAAGVPAAAGAAGASEPRRTKRYEWIIDCDEWGARPPDGQVQESQAPTNKIIVHHMAFPNVDDFSRAQAIALARECQDLHMDDNGWTDTGQHFTVSRGGFALEGRHGSLDALRAGSNQIIGAHCPGENGRAIGIENEGLYVEVTPTPQQVAKLVRLCVEICKQYGLYAHDIFGHWDFRETLCPGAAFYRMFPEVRRRIAEQLDTDESDIPERRWPDPWRFNNSPVVNVVQYLLVAQGYDLNANGTYDDATLAAIQDFQQVNGLAVDKDGTCTPETWEALTPELGPGSEGPAVRGLQLMLKRKEFGEATVTGGFDTATTEGVRQLRDLHGLPEGDGVDASAWCAAVGGIVREAFDA